MNQESCAIHIVLLTPTAVMETFRHRMVTEATKLPKDNHLASGRDNSKSNSFGFQCQSLKGEHCAGGCKRLINSRIQAGTGGPPVREALSEKSLPLQEKGVEHPLRPCPSWAPCSLHYNLMIPGGLSGQGEFQRGNKMMMRVNISDTGGKFLLGWREGEGRVIIFEFLGFPP